jgi:gliding motility-associated protein GldM
MALPREPRQKMINMMYLVLTAMLALNVSSEILNAFKTVNRSLEKTNETVEASTGTYIKSLEELAKKTETQERGTYWLAKAKEVRKLSDDVYNFIQNLKDTIFTEARGDYSKPEKRYKEDNLDIATRIMVDKGGGKKLYNMLQDYKTNVLAVDTAIKKEFDNSLQIDLSTPQTRSKSNLSWEVAYFRMVPVVAALTILSKFQNDVKTSENKIVAFCHKEVGKVEIVFDAYEPIIGQSSTYIMPGQEIEITAGIGAFSKAAQPTVIIGNKVVPLDADGVAKTKITGGGVGSNTIPIKITYFNQTTGKEETKEKKIEYTVGTSTAAVQLDKMNVLFIGVDNPITISGSGGGAESLQLSIEGGGGQLTKTGSSTYTVRVNQETDECWIRVRTSDGKVTPVRYRVRSIPNPTPMVGQRESGDFPAAEFKAQAGVRAILQNFFYETQFNVLSYRITGDGAGFDEGIIEVNNTGAAWNEARGIINRCRPGSYITIDEIRAIGPDSRTRKLTPLIYNLK